MSKEAYKSALEMAQAELDKLIAEQMEIAKRITKIRSTITSLTHLCREEDETDFGLTKTPRPGTEHWGLSMVVQEIIKKSNEALTPLQIREELIKWGFDISTQKNLMASLHTILKRLVTAGFVVAISTKLGPKRYLRKDHPLLLSIIDKTSED